MKMVLNLEDNYQNSEIIDEPCCKEMKNCIESGIYDMSYNKIFNEFRCLRRDGGVSWEFYYCPFCGKPTKSKYDIYLKTLKNEFKIDDSDESLIPEEFKSDAWWKKRGL